MDVNLCELPPEFQIVIVLLVLLVLILLGRGRSGPNAALIKTVLVSIVGSLFKGRKKND